MPAKFRTDTTWNKYRQRRPMTQHNHGRQAVKLWSIQVLHILDPSVSRGMSDVIGLDWIGFAT